MNKMMKHLIFVFIFSILFFDSAEAQYDILLGSMQTRYAYSGEKEPRAVNIELAASKLNELIISPSEAFSFNTTVGTRTTNRGFKMAPVIVKGELVEGVGGGVCQVAGTLHASALLSGLEILESYQHSRTSSYIEPGLDSTVAWPAKDLKFRNIYNFPIKMKVIAYRDKAKRIGILNIEIFGEKKMFNVVVSNTIHRKSKIHIRKIIREDKPKTYKEIVEKGTPTMDITRVRKVYSLDNKLILEEEIKIHYTASDRIIEVGVL